MSESFHKAQTNFEKFVHSCSHFKIKINTFKYKISITNLALIYADI